MPEIRGFRVSEAQHFHRLVLTHAVLFSSHEFFRLVREQVRFLVVVPQLVQPLLHVL